MFGRQFFSRLLGFAVDALRAVAAPSGDGQLLTVVDGLPAWAAPPGPAAPSKIIAGPLEIRDGANPQFLNVYQTYVDPGNYQRGAFGFRDGAMQFISEKAGSGIACNLIFSSSQHAYLFGAGAIFLGSAGAERWVIDANYLIGIGHLVPRANNVYDVGGDGLLVRNVKQGGYHELTETTAPGAGPANTARLYVEDDGAGKTRLMVQFASGAAKQIEIES